MVISFPGTTKGFTLLELLVVIAIISAMATLVLPKMRFPNEGGQRTLLAIQKPIEKWRLTALEKSKNYLIRLNGRDKTISIVSAEDLELLERKQSQNFLEHKKVDSEFYIHSIHDQNTRNADIEINSDGSTIPFDVYIEKEGDRLKYTSLMVPGRIQKWVAEEE